MGTKTISIMDDVYERLIAIKRPDESFSDEIRRLTETKGSIMEFAGIWSKEYGDDMNRILKEKKKGTRVKEILERFEE